MYALEGGTNHSSFNTSFLGIVNDVINGFLFVSEFSIGGNGSGYICGVAMVLGP